ncbi:MULTISPECIES: hypothetical protein [Flavobacterium]|uniref:DUF4304 domain-containing protein n=1 Tax=Flavobacterium jumunjinense TaxID=998845 RepID=A0ABV5GPS9_9FLAO|nr:MULTISPECIES: hypothetical protein [Flavobacterium]
MNKEFTTKERKKVFDEIFKEKIVPLFNDYGFSLHTKTSKRLFKNLENKLSVFVFIEYKNRFKYYDISIAYFDEEIGNVYDDNYLALVNGMNPSFSGENKEEIKLSVDDWITEMKSTVFPFIENHSTHKSIVESDQFYISKSRASKITERLKGH